MNNEVLEPRQIEAFSAVMAAGSITGAARLLGRSQPAITRLIQDLETDLGFQLLHRRGPRITPTDRGLLFHEEVERLMTGLRHIRRRADAIAHREAPAIEIAATPALAAGLVPAGLARLGEGPLPRHMHIRSSSPEQVVQSVLARTADIGISSLPVDHPGLDVHWIAGAPCAVAVSNSDPLAQSPVIALSDVARRRVITVANPYRLHRRIVQAFAETGAEVTSIIETNSSLNALLAARAGLGVALIGPATAYGIPVEGVTIRPLDVPILSFWALVTPLAKPLSSEIKALILSLRDAGAALIPGFRLHDPEDRESLMASIYGSDAAAPAVDDLHELPHQGGAHQNPGRP